ncbi:MAG: type II secretion system protein [Candidatus Paceibacterota bacterium]|jgi:Tfp pilus assembly protein PilE
MKKGFTMIELLIVIGITAVLSVVSVGFYANQQKAKLLESTAQEIASYLKYTQQKSVSQEQGLQWGIHFDNPTSGSDFYALYTGTTYSSAVETKYLPAGITFQTPTPGSSTDASYEKLTGLLYGGSYQQIILVNTSGLTKNILTCQQGLISYNADISVCGGIDTTPPVVSSVTASNTSHSSYVDSPFDLSASINEEQGGISSCEYTINGGTNWYSANFSGTGPDYTCSKTNITSSDGSSLTLNIRTTSNGGIGTGSSIDRTVDDVEPTCSDDWTDNWTVTSPVNITISSIDTGNSGLASTKYCVDTLNICYPSTSYTVPVAVSCVSGSTCTQYIRYAAWDNVNNVSSIYSKRVRQDLQAPTDGILTATPGDSQVSTSWTIASDSGSGLAVSNTYKLVFSTSSSPTVNCISDTQIYTGTSTSYLHTGLTIGTIYYYRVCASDVLNNISTGSIISETPGLPNGETCSLGSDCVSENCYVDIDGDHYAPASGTKICQANSQISGTDCCDSDNRVYPGEVTYYSSTNNCGSWDYDCSGDTDKSGGCIYRACGGSSYTTCHTTVGDGVTCGGYTGNWPQSCTNPGSTSGDCGSTGSYSSCAGKACYTQGSGSCNYHSGYWCTSTSRSCTCK